MLVSILAIYIDSSFDDLGQHSGLEQGTWACGFGRRAFCFVYLCLGHVGLGLFSTVVGTSNRVADIVCGVDTSGHVFHILRAAPGFYDSGPLAMAPSA